MGLIRGSEELLNYFYFISPFQLGVLPRCAQLADRIPHPTDVIVSRFRDRLSDCG